MYAFPHREEGAASLSFVAVEVFQKRHCYTFGMLGPITPYTTLLPLVCQSLQNHEPTGFAKKISSVYIKKK